ncbi:MAG: hemerythrin domain-containing protein [Myxococcales bacterium]|jgi:hemerythrin-like domain-containing protein
MDAISLLKQDHQNVAQIFEQFEKTGEKAFKTKGGLISKATVELVRHMAAEEQLFYPMARERFGTEGERLSLEALEEHHLVKLLLKELEGMEPDSERYEAKVAVLKGVFEHHIHEEEEQLFPMAQKKLTKTELADLGEQIEAKKKTAPTRPDPYASDVPTRRRPAAERGRITATAAAARTAKAGRGTKAAAASKRTASKASKSSTSRSTAKKK